MNRTPLIAILPALLAAVAMLATTRAEAGTDSVSSLGTCRAIAPDMERLRCYDGLADPPAVIPATLPATPASGATGPGPPRAAVPAPAAADLFGRPPGEVQRIVEAEHGGAGTDVQASTLRACRRGHDGKLQFSLENGQQWSQIDTTAATCAAGEAVEIHRAALGSYLLRKTTGGAGIRVRRTD